MSPDRTFEFNRADLMNLADHLPEVPGIDMLVNLPEQEQLLDIRIAEMTPRIEGEPKGRQERGLLCVTNERLLFFLRVPEVGQDRELATATGYLVECLLRRQPLDRERAARYFPKKESAVMALRRRLAELYFPDLMPALSLPLAGLAAIMPVYDGSRQACLDLEIDVRAEGGLLPKLVHLNPQLRLVLGPRYADKPYPQPEPSLPLVAVCPVRELVQLVELLRDAQANIDYDSLPERLFSTPWALSLLCAQPRAKAELVHGGQRVSGKIGIERGQMLLARKVKRTALFNVGAVEDLSWDEKAGLLSLRGPGLSYRVEAEPRSAQLAWIRSYLEELLAARREVWEDPFARAELQPEAKPDPVGELLRYHLETCNDPAVFLGDRLTREQIERFMDGFGQLLPPEENPQALILLAGTAQGQVGMLFTDRGLYARQRGGPGQRFAFARVSEAAQSKKGFLSSSLSIGPLAFKMDGLGKETAQALGRVLQEVSQRAG